MSNFFEKLLICGIVFYFFKCYHFITPLTKEGVKMDFVKMLLSRLSEEQLEKVEELIEDLLIISDNEF